MRKRILWLFNHTSLRKFEVPLLIELGYEVFCPKILELDYGDFSVSVSYEFDQSLSIPEEVLSFLNTINFYKPVTTEVMTVVNQYFDIVFCLAFPDVLSAVVRHFQGAIVLHVFGRESTKDYSNLLYSANGSAVLTEIKSIGCRFWFAQAYDNLAEIESPVLQNRAVYLPIGVRNTSVNNEWEGGDPRILFVSPKIKMDPYYNSIYQNFCRDFGDIPHVIGGAQPIAVPEDPTVTGFLSDENYTRNMKRLSAMYYHSREPRHLHYHPIEAMKWGMPLVFMKGGMLDHMGGGELPGCCDGVRDARNKLKRLVKGDKKLIRKIKESQTALLNPFQMEYCKSFWIEGMNRIAASVPERRTSGGRVPRKQKRIAVIIPNAYTGGVLDYAIRFSTAVNRGIQQEGGNANIVFAYPDVPEYKKRDYFRALREDKIPIRPYHTREVSREWMARALTLAGYQPRGGLYIPAIGNMLQDGIADFEDCDYAFIMADAFASIAPLFFTVPFAIVAHDSIQRYVTGVVNKQADCVKLNNQRHADFVLVTSEPTYFDVLQYSGIPPEKVLLTPLLLSIPKNDLRYKGVKEKDYFLWSTNPTPHKNHLAALEAIQMYYAMGGTLNCVITGAYSERMRPGASMGGAAIDIDYGKKIHEKIAASETLSRRIIFRGNMPKSEYHFVLSNSAFVFHPGYGDNGNGTVVDAAGFGVPSLSSDYPGARYISKFSGIPMSFMDPFNPSDMAGKLLDMEQHFKDYAKALPDETELQKCTVEYTWKQLYSVVKQILSI